MFVTVKGQFKTLKIHESPAYSLQCPSGFSHTDNKIQVYYHHLGSCIPSGPSPQCTPCPSTFLLSHSTFVTFVFLISPNLLLPQGLHICCSFCWKHAYSTALHGWPPVLGALAQKSPPPQAPPLSGDPPYCLEPSARMCAVRAGALTRLHPLYSGAYNEQRPSHD